MKICTGDFDECDLLCAFRRIGCAIKAGQFTVFKTPEQKKILATVLIEKIKRPSPATVVKKIESDLSLRVFNEPKVRMKIVRPKKKGCCFYCERIPDKRNELRMTRDHVIPRSRGGKALLHNIVEACNVCNEWKANKTLREFANEVKKRCGKRRGKIMLKNINRLRFSDHYRKNIEILKLRRQKKF